MIYFSQLDIFHVLERALRRSKLPLYYTQGFSPRVKISFLNGLKLGLEGKIDIIFYFIQPIDLSQVKRKLSSQLPEGLRIVS
jgi:radical SAM-linked protein